MAGEQPRQELAWELTCGVKLLLWLAMTDWTGAQRRLQAFAFSSNIFTVPRVSRWINGGSNDTIRLCVGTAKSRDSGCMHVISSFASY